MGVCFIKQPNGLYCRYSSIVDAPTHYNLTKDDIREMLLESAMAEINERIDNLDKRAEWGWSIEDVKSNTIVGNNITQEGFDFFCTEIEKKITKEE